MRIVIDTKQDSKEEIKHVINVLTAMLGEGTTRSEQEQTQQRDIFSQGNILGSVFGPPSTEGEAEKTDKAIEKKKIDIDELGLDELETY